MVHAGQVVALDLDDVVAVALEAATRTSAGSLRPSTVGPAILAPLRCRIGSTAPSRAGLRNEMPFHEPSSGPVSASPSPTTASAMQVGVVHHRAERVHEDVAELAALVDRAGRRHRDVARDAAGCGELAEQPPHARLVLGHLRVDLAVGALEIAGGDQRRTAVPGPAR